MTPNPKDYRFIRHDVPKGASENVVNLYDEYQTILEIEKQVGWPGVKSENFVLSIIPMIRTLRFYSTS